MVNKIVDKVAFKESRKYKKNVIKGDKITSRNVKILLPI